MNINELMPSKYIKAESLNSGSMIAVIESLKLETIQGEDKLVLTFENGKSVTVNQTRKDSLVELFGEETDNWIGKVIKLAKGKTMYMGKPTACVDIVAASKEETAKAQSQPKIPF